MDDRALRPNAPLAGYDPEVDDFDTLASAEDKQVSEAYFSPAWAKVEDMFNEAITEARKPVRTDLVAEEFKIQSVANHLYAEKLIQILGRVKDAVTAVESSRPAKPTEGGK